MVCDLKLPRGASGVEELGPHVAPGAPLPQPILSGLSHPHSPSSGVPSQLSSASTQSSANPASLDTTLSRGLLGHLLVCR